MPEVPVSPKFQLYCTSWKAEAPALTEESVEAVASKNTVKGEIPEARGMLALSVKAPLLPVQVAAAAVVGLAEVTVTMVDP